MYEPEKRPNNRQGYDASDFTIPPLVFPRSNQDREQSPTSRQNASIYNHARNNSLSSLTTVVGDTDSILSLYSTSTKVYASHQTGPYSRSKHQKRPSGFSSSQVTLVGRSNDIEKQFRKVNTNAVPPPPPTPTVKKVARGVGICTGLCLMTVLFTLSMLSVLFMILSINANLIAWPKHEVGPMNLREYAGRKATDGPAKEP
ncbi:hypothetical protein CC1G_09445 [Coprinopsis cinerea okayama7|uniref:Uncharacterized protein n=1 Tax=Coprinopsis cinerea (strain Okayama-7 / 130 / ATCC MYA-4618 / FGSC 9003) TaxID=240176 RepID=A8NIM4_COPC7|nr:hypothetical protein CC1G_09445 [Coprinopsis cinerea okayama7\|eukprot:XP_001834031.1 hypothetical protein CC1G_09445 [Coprinopsis cinerea okayama7\